MGISRWRPEFEADGASGWWTPGEFQCLWGLSRGTRPPKHVGNQAGSGVPGSPVSCRKSTSVIPQVSTVWPVLTRTPGLSSAQGAIASAPGPTRKRAQRGGYSKEERPRPAGDWRIWEVGGVGLGH